MENETPKKYATIVYEITDMDEWRKTNPLTYEHHGMTAITAGCGDAYERSDIMEDLLNRCDQESCVLPTSLRRDIERFLHGENSNFSQHEAE